MLNLKKITNFLTIDTERDYAPIKKQPPKPIGTELFNFKN